MPLAIGNSYVANTYKNNVNNKNQNSNKVNFGMKVSTDALISTLTEVDEFFPAACEIRDAVAAKSTLKYGFETWSDTRARLMADETLGKTITTLVKKGRNFWKNVKNPTPVQQSNWVVEQRNTLFDGKEVIDIPTFKKPLPDLGKLENSIIIDDLKDVVEGRKQISNVQLAKELSLLGDSDKEIKAALNRPDSGISKKETDYLLMNPELPKVLANPPKDLNEVVNSMSVAEIEAWLA